MDNDTGRFRKLKPEERVCMLCQTNNTEDEIHFVCQCNVYDELRNNLYARISANLENFNELSDEEKFVYMLCHEVKIFGDYISEAWKRRSDLLYNGN